MLSWSSFCFPGILKPYIPNSPISAIPNYLTSKNSLLYNKWISYGVVTTVSHGVLLILSPFAAPSMIHPPLGGVPTAGDADLNRWMLRSAFFQKSLAPGDGIQLRFLREHRHCWLGLLLSFHSSGTVMTGGGTNIHSCQGFCRFQSTAMFWWPGWRHYFPGASGLCSWREGPFFTQLGGGQWQQHLNESCLFSVVLPLVGDLGAGMTINRLIIKESIKDGTIRSSQTSNQSNQHYSKPLKPEIFMDARLQGGGWCSGRSALNQFQGAECCRWK